MKQVTLEDLKQHSFYRTSTSGSSYASVGSMIITSVVLWAIKLGAKRVVLAQKEAVILLALTWYDSIAKRLDIPGVPEYVEEKVEAWAREQFRKGLDAAFDMIELVL